MRIGLQQTEAIVKYIYVVKSNLTEIYGIRLKQELIFHLNQFFNSYV